jgi:hypothetical protein
MNIPKHVIDSKIHANFVYVKWTLIDKIYYNYVI